jgi:hypothetical protein
MATVNFSVPDQTKRRFDRAFRGRNKSAVIARLMEHAVEEEQRRERRTRAIDALLALRRRIRPVSGSELRKARLTGRP